MMRQCRVGLFVGFLRLLVLGVGVCHVMLCRGRFAGPQKAEGPEGLDEGFALSER